LVRFVLLSGQHHDTIGVMPLLEGIDFKALIGDKAFDSNTIRVELDDGARSLLSLRMPIGKPQIPHDTECTSGGICARPWSYVCRATLLAC
jgi:hypothetical protein